MGKQYWPAVKEERQAEFLVHEFFPWSAIGEVGAMTPAIAARVRGAIPAGQHQPVVNVLPKWYF
jgi:hypothetical protein